MRKLLFLLTTLSLLTFAFGQKKVKNLNTTSASENNDSAFFSTTKFRLVGPFRGGRSAAVAGSYQNKNTFYFGSTGGGVWKTTDGGSNWKNITDKYFGGSRGAVAVAQGDETILYAGTG